MQIIKDLPVKVLYILVYSKPNKHLRQDSYKNDLVSLAFRYIECANNCRQGDIVSKCGNEANDELLLFYRRFMTTIKLLMSLYHSARTGSELQFDDTCDKLGTFTA
uniref:Uncharacterized protein n=1 Tax=Romanomermis culicivorax TaxID=13658 RepID=A0A915KM63_ROMCU